MKSQKSSFQLPPGIHYLNAAYMTPLPKSVYEAGLNGLQWKLDPSKITSQDFFTLPAQVRKRFSELVKCDREQVAIVPSVSYGLKSAINNLPTDAGTHAVVVEHEFPSDYYTIQQWCRTSGQELRIVQAPAAEVGRGRIWNEQIIEAITDETTVVVTTPLHWADGTLFDLKKIGERCKQTQTRFIVDGTQSAGMLDIDVVDCNIDAFICAAYKWLLGPYSVAVAYYHQVYNDGVPIEDSWMNRANAEDFSNLTLFTDDYRPGAARYNMGETTSPIHLSMLNQSLQMIASWGVDNLQQYCKNLVQPLISYLQKNDLWVEEDSNRAGHLFGFAIPVHADKQHVIQELQKRKVFVSLRGESIRVSPHIYNDSNDIDALIYALGKSGIGQ